MPPASRGGLISAMMGPKSAASFRPKEKYLIFLVLATFGFVCFGAIFFLPTEKTGSDDSPPNMNRVYRVYKQLQDVQDILLPAPPLSKFFLLHLCKEIVKVVVFIFICFFCVPYHLFDKCILIIRQTVKVADFFQNQ